MTDSIAMLIKYLTMRTKFPEWWKGLDIHEPKLNKMVSNGYLFVLPQCDAQGRRVVYSRAASMKDATASDIMRAHMLTFEALLEDENVQNNGLTYVFDEKDVGWSHVSIWTPSEVTKAFSCCEKALPQI